MLGNNLYGQLGIGSSITSSIGNTGNTLSFIDFDDIDNIKSILFILGWVYTCTLFDNKKVKYFGRGANELPIQLLSTFQLLLCMNVKI